MIDIVQTLYGSVCSGLFVPDGLSERQYLQQTVCVELR